MVLVALVMVVLAVLVEVGCKWESLFVCFLSAFLGNKCFAAASHVRQ